MSRYHARFKRVHVQVANKQRTPMSYVFLNLAHTLRQYTALEHLALLIEIHLAWHVRDGYDQFRAGGQQ